MTERKVTAEEEILNWLDDGHYQYQAKNDLYNAQYNAEIRDAIIATIKEHAVLKERAKGLLSSYDGTHPQDWHGQMLSLLADLAAGDKP